MALTEIWMPSPHYSTSRGPYNKLVFHTTEGAMKIRDLGAWFANPSAQCSSHHGADNYERGVFGAYVYENHKAWTQGNANPYCLSIELCAYASWSRSTWLNDKAVLVDNAAQWLRYCVDKYGVPWTVLSDSQAQNPDVRGICQHVNFGSWGSGHHDCGSGFPMDVVVDKAKKQGGGGTAPVPPPEDEGMDAVVIPPGTGTDTADPSSDIGVSLDKTSYTKVGFCCDPGRVGAAEIRVRVAWHRAGGSGWGVGTAVMTAANPKAIVTMDGKPDGVSFRRQDAAPVTLYPNFA